MKAVISELEKSKCEILKVIARKPKDENAKVLLDITKRTIAWLKEENEKIENDIKSYGTIEVEIENYRFVKDERITKGISVYMVGSDGLYEYIDCIKMSKAHLNMINNLESLRIVSMDWYLANKKICEGKEK